MIQSSAEYATAAQAQELLTLVEEAVRMPNTTSESSVLRWTTPLSKVPPSVERHLPPVTDQVAINSDELTASLYISWSNLVPSTEQWLANTQFRRSQVLGGGEGVADRYVNYHVIQTAGELGLRRRIHDRAPGDTAERMGNEFTHFFRGEVTFADLIRNLIEAADAAPKPDESDQQRSERESVLFVEASEVIDALSRHVRASAS